ncbi:LysR family transcriptional regulator [Pandoraea sp. XY-2]|uniref:LysR family transcriptional regulator n=1 Tax=Pandoraea sp. XY-2 TaxID=2518599 RepID=UPI00101B0D3C|nr:LysR family transcriptional regulator [Pandoraea sp. XY-2]QBC30578.1 LysR family transcriptional regulator [Pandoraea sp. XY-2]
MELRHLRYFIAVAEQLSVRAASEILHVTQPAVSRQIRDLEETIGAALFTRTARGLVLTAAGTAYLAEARDILARVESANRTARRLASGVTGRLRIGFVENASWDGLVPAAFNAFQRTTPDVALELIPMNTPEQLDAIAAGTLDGGFCYRFGALREGCAEVPLLEHDVVLAVPADWPMGREGDVDIASLRAHPFVAFPRAVYPAYYDRLIAACAEHGLTLDIRQEVSTEAAILSLVSAGVGLAIVNDANRDRPPARVRFAAIRDLSVRLPLAFCHSAQHPPQPALQRFIEQLAAVQAA